MEATHTIEIFHEVAHATDGPDLLLRQEPGYRVFFGNLVAILFPFLGSKVSITSKPAEFWGDVFIYEGVSWWPMLESALWHLVLIAGLWNVGLIWGPGHVLAPRMAFNRSDVIYYTEPTFPALKAAHPPVNVQPRSSARSQTPAALRVAAEAARKSGAGAAQAPPNVALGKGSQLAMMAANAALPEMPMAATGGSHLVLPADALAAIAPAPEVRGTGAGGRGGNMMEVTVVAPPPEVSGLGKGRGGNTGAPGFTAVAPAPGIEGAVRGTGKFEIGQSQVVAPSPQLPMHERRGGGLQAGAGLGSGSGTVVVPPAPTVDRAGNFTAGGADSLGSGGTRIVPPPPSVDGVGATGGTGGRTPGTAIAGQPWQAVPPPPTVIGEAGGRLGGGGVGAGGMQAVPPAPSVGGSGNGGGGVKGLLASLFGGGSEVVPPAPSVEGSGGGGSGRGTGLGGNGVEAVGPAPSVDGLGQASGNGRGGALGGGGVQAVGPAPSLGGTEGGGRRMAALAGAPDGVGVSGGGSGGRGGKSAGMIGRALPPPDTPNPEAEPDNVPGAHELPVRIISLAMALPNTSFFSNYEVFIAERRTKTNRTQLIKLVYESLPYQERLSNYNLKETKIYKLRVTRDHSCDETLIQMTWPDQAGPKPQLAGNAAPEEVNPKDKLPCYRTTADDYRKALTHAK